MHIHELNPATPPEPPAPWRLQLEQFWRQASDLQHIDMRVALEMRDGAGAQRILESWQKELAERRRSKKNRKKKASKRRFQYGVYGGWFYPGYHNNSGADSSSDGADGGGGESIQEQHTADIQDILPRFVEFCCSELGIESQPQIRLRRDPAWSERNGTFGKFDHDTGVIELSVAQRHPLDIMRTLAHELVHHHQGQQQDLPNDAGRTGSPWENEANALAGRIMRDFVEQNPDVFGQDLDEGWRERAAGLAAAACVAGTPGCATTGTTTAADALRTVQTVGRTAQNLPTRAGAEEELRQELKNLLRRQRGVQESSGYIPTEAEKDDPRFSMALTADVRPGETGRQANKLGLQTDSQGHPALLMKRLSNLLESVKHDDIIDEDEELAEVAMNPGTYRRFLSSADAEGIRAGFEAELIFRDAQADPDEGGESEPDYDADERPGDIDDIINFFTSGEDPMSMRAAQRLNQELTEQFMDWAREQFANDYFDQDRFMSWAEDNVWEDEADNYREDARANLDDEDATDEDIEREAVTLFRDDVERDWDRSGQWYERASEELFDEYMSDLDQQDWLDSEGLRYMSDVAQEHNLDWPYWTEGGGGGGSRSWEDIGNSLGRATGMPVEVSSGYHSTARRPGQYIIEPDGSLQADVDETGLEIVSPPLPLAEALEQLRRVIDWANDSNEGNAYTNSSTGLHMGMSLPYKGGDVDPIKLILFMGDKELLERFDRQSNTYARSALDRLQTKIRDVRTAKPEQILGVMELMKKNLIELAYRDLERGVLGSKYVSVNPHNGYIEFRGPGGDYLAKEDEIDGVLENTMMQLAYAMHIAGRGDLYRDEYAKKLYKTLTGFQGAVTSKGTQSPRYRTEIETETDDPFMRLFADYSAGRINAAGLKQRWTAAVLAGTDGTQDDRAAWQGKFAGNYEVIDLATGRAGDRDSRTVIDEFPAASDDEALEIAAQKWSGKGIMFTVRRKIEDPDQPKDRRTKVAKRIRQAQLDKAKDEILAKSQQTQGSDQYWRVTWYEQRNGETVQDALRIQAGSAQEAIERLQRTLQDMGRQGREFEAEQVGSAAPAATNTDIGEPRVNTTRDPDANWAIVRRNNGEIVIPFQRSTQPEALEYFRDWANSRVGSPDNYQLVPLTSTSQRQGAQVTAGTPSAGEWTGAWVIRTADGYPLHRFHGIGNNQADANRHALRWLTDNGYGSGLEVEVVPEMR
jgi:hypothetical protein